MGVRVMVVVACGEGALLDPAVPHGNKINYTNLTTDANLNPRYVREQSKAPVASRASRGTMDCV